jgi:hypothetical protein
VVSWLKTAIGNLNLGVEKTQRKKGEISAAIAPTNGFKFDTIKIRNKPFGIRRFKAQSSRATQSNRSNSKPPI